jgi:hypothetical protein
MPAGPSVGVDRVGGPWLTVVLGFIAVVSSESLVNGNNG